MVLNGGRVVVVNPLRWYQRLLVRGRMKPVSLWVFRVVALIGLSGAALVPFHVDRVASDPNLQLELSFWVIMAMVPVLMLTALATSIPDMRTWYVGKLSSKGLVLVEKDIAYRLLEPLIRDYAHVPAAQQAVALFANNMRYRQRMVGEQWYLSMSPPDRFMLNKVLLNMSPGTPLGDAARTCGCVETLRSHMEQVLDGERERLIAELTARRDKKAAAATAAQNTYEEASAAQRTAEALLEEQLAGASQRLTTS